MDLMPLASEFYVNFPSDVSKKIVELNNSCEVSMTSKPRANSFLKLSALKNKYIFPVKVSKFQNEFMKSSFFPLYKSKIVKISAL